MTTDELVTQGIAYLKEHLTGEMPWYMRQFHASSIGGTLISRFSVALNDETKDVRYLERTEFYLPVSYGEKGTKCERIVEVYEVTPNVEVRTQYYPKEP